MWWRFYLHKNYFNHWTVNDWDTSAKTWNQSWSISYWVAGGFWCRTQTLMDRRWWAGQTCSSTTFDLNCFLTLIFLHEPKRRPLWSKELQWSILQFWLNFDSLCKDTKLQNHVSVQTLLNPTIYWCPERLSTAWRRSEVRGQVAQQKTHLHVSGWFTVSLTSQVKVLKVLKFSTNVRICCLSSVNMSVCAETRTRRRFHASSHRIQTHHLLISDWLSACQVVKSGTFVCAGGQRFHHTPVTRFPSVKKQHHLVLLRLVHQRRSSWRLIDYTHGVFSCASCDSTEDELLWGGATGLQDEKSSDCTASEFLIHVSEVSLIPGRPEKSDQEEQISVTNITDSFNY